jgi:Glycosyl transferase family 2
MEPKTSIVIATRDRVRVLRRVVEAVQQDPATHEIVVVDDGSSDGTADWLRAREAQPGALPPLRALRREGVGPSGARQAGVEVSSGELVLLLDDDVVPRAGLVSGHAAALGGDPARVTLGYSPLALPPERGPDDVALYAYARDYERRCARWERGEAPILHNCWGGNVGLWREAALAVGLISPAFAGPGAFHEDRDFGLRAERAGLHGTFDRALRADHHHRRGFAAALADAERRGAGLVRLHRAHPELLGPWTPSAAAAGLPRPLAAVVRRPGAAAAALPLCRAAIAAGGRMRAWAVQDAAFKLARRVCEQRGAAAESRR